MFKSAGALRAADEHVYIVRSADREVASYLQQGRFVHLTEPRQQGKTSLLNGLDRIGGLAGHAILRLTATSLSANSTDDWFERMGGKIRDALLAVLEHKPKTFDKDAVPRLAQGRNGWEPFLACLATKARRPVVLIVDEVDVIRFEGSELFFSVIKTVCDMNESRLSIILSGRFHPDDLIADRNSSPFNAANYVRVDDFSEEQVLELVSKGPWEKVRHARLANEIYHWTAGHPAMTQHFCERLSNNLPHENVAGVAQSYVNHDQNQLPRVIKVLDDEPQLRAELDRIYNGQRVLLRQSLPTAPATRLRLLGVIKADENGYCVLRNPIFEEACQPARRQPQVFVSYRRDSWPAIEPLKTGLLQHGIRVFVDQMSLVAGEPYPARLRQAIRLAPIFLLVVSEGDLTACDQPGDWLREEVVQALVCGSRIVPVAVHPCQPPGRRELPESMWPITERHWLGMTASNVDTVIAQLVELARHT